MGPVLESVFFTQHAIKLVIAQLSSCMSETSIPSGDTAIPSLIFAKADLAIGMCLVIK